MVYIKDTTGRIYINNAIELVSHDVRFTTTKPQSSGRFYYEMTHIEGQNYHLACFKCNSAYICAYKWARKYKLFIFYHNLEVIEVNQSYSDMGFIDVQPDSTIGLSFDTYSNMFSVFYADQVKRFTVKSDMKMKTVTPYFWEGADPNVVYKDNISVNFGEKEFVHTIPYGYISWDQSNIVTCKQSKKKPTKLFLYVIIATT